MCNVRASNCAAQPPQANCGSVSDGPGTLQRCQIQMGFRLTFFLNTVSRLASTVAARNISPAIVPMISACTARSSVWRMIETPSEVSVSRRRSRSTDFTLPLQGYLPLTSGPFRTIARWSMISLVLQKGGRRSFGGGSFCRVRKSAIAVTSASGGNLASHTSN